MHSILKQRPRLILLAAIMGINSCAGSGRLQNSPATGVRLETGMVVERDAIINYLQKRLLASDLAPPLQVCRMGDSLDTVLNDEFLAWLKSRGLISQVHLGCTVERPSLTIESIEVTGPSPHLTAKYRSGRVLCSEMLERADLEQEERGIRVTRIELVMRVTGSVECGDIYPTTRRGNDSAFSPPPRP